MKQFTRGASVHISVTFQDHSGAIVTPTGANVTLSYVPLNADPPDRVFTTYALTADALPNTTDWVYDWDSSIASAGVVYGTAFTTTVGVPVSKVDLQFRLTANRANKELAGDDCSGTGY